MKQYIFIFIVFITSKMFCQSSLPDSNATWNIYWESFGEEVLGINGDTTINTKVYQKIYRYDIDTVYNPDHFTYIGGLRDDGHGKAYFIWDQQPDEEVLLYDFTLDISDTVKSNSETGYLSYLDAIVMNIDSIEIYGKHHKRYLLDANGNDYWIEGVGSTKGLLHPIMDYIIGTNIELWCHKRNDSIFFLGNTECGNCFCDIDFTVTNHTLESNIGISIYPNPTRGLLGIILNMQYNDSTVEIYNESGQLVYNTDYLDKQINLSHLNSGLYVVRLTIDNEVYSKKILLE